ncbi:50S ribosomal protein L30 [Candidatus Legionella polyplacis]|uniref:Large ribosomal subunit protein uL30 n=1 Tax=Candidatus Legionella polyplacis TaxID=2005262 RepID=A0ABZ2GW38_9GAMM|nr:50S ribosomal protein L30 [Candidatus Legionella polyplacis]ATW01749.1 50S ribosomal protein L30 [Candidatus Legionella polyplacis]
MIKKIKITLVKSIIGCRSKHVNIIRQLGLKRVNSSVIKIDNPSIRGLISVVSYLLKYEECI